MDGYGIRIGVSAGVKDQGFSFSLTTPDRTYNLSAQSEHDRDHWIEVIGRVIDRPLTPQDSASMLFLFYKSQEIYKFNIFLFFPVCGRLIRKRTNTNSINIFSPR